MKKMIVKGGRKISGKINVQGAKNAALPIIVAALLVEGKVMLKNIPNISDIRSFIEILEYLGCEIVFEDNVLHIDTRDMKNRKLPKKLTQKTRASFIFYGALLARFGKANVEKGGGCRIGERPTDIHEKAFEEIKRGEKEIELSFPSVGATENLLIYMAGRDEQFTLKNASIEPEVQDLILFLRKCGTKIRRTKRTIVVQGKQKKKRVEYTVMTDRIAALTYIMAGKMTGGEVVVSNINYQKHIDPILEDIKKKKIETGVHPKFPTDAGAIVLPYLAATQGKTTIYKETVFENRMGILEEMYKKGADIDIEGNSATVRGGKKRAGKMQGRDLRMTAGLILFALGIKGKSEVTGIEFLERGYENFASNLRKLGADVKMV